MVSGGREGEQTSQFQFGEIAAEGQEKVELDFSDEYHKRLGQFKTQVLLFCDAVRKLRMTK